MKINEIMVTKLESIEPNAPVYDAIEKMVDRRIRSILVRPKDEKDVYGIVTARDIVFKVIGNNLDPIKSGLKKLLQSLSSVLIKIWISITLSV